MNKPGVINQLTSKLSFLFTRPPHHEIFDKVMTFIASSKIQGDYLEFGVYQGNSFTSSYLFAQRYGLSNMRFFAFDSFEGLPKIKDVDKTYNKFHEGEYCCDVDSFKKILQKNKVDLSKVEIVKGFYEDVLSDKLIKKTKLSNAAVVMIDCDLYQSAMVALEFITDLLVTGSIILFDDWFTFRGDPGCGEQRASREWLDNHPEIRLIEYHKFGWCGNSFIVNKCKK